VAFTTTQFDDIAGDMRSAKSAIEQSQRPHCSWIHMIQMLLSTKS